MASATIEIETTRDIARQILRHRSFAFQEFSQRYADPVKDLAFTVREARLQDTKNRQNSIVLDLTNPEHREINNLWLEKQQEVIRSATAAYTWAVTNGIAKEQARAVLPEGNTMSRLYMQGTIRSFIHYVEVRSDQSTQSEHREIALAVAQAISKIFDFQGLQ
jgi:thymidylate synthase (FAD)